MLKHYPIFTLEAECQDCYKCVRHCPVKAIKVVDGRAAVVPDLCVACGTCARICPAGAKQVRNDVRRVELLIEETPAVYVSLAPSWVSEFRGVEPEAMVTALKRLGFTGVSETALGAQVVTAETAALLRQTETGARKINL